MATNESMNDSVATIIKCILISNKDYLVQGMPIKLLDKEFKDYEGKYIPYRELGFSSLPDYLRSLERRGQIRIVDKRGFIVVCPCITEDVAHVSKLVRGQNPSKKRSQGGRRVMRSYPRESQRPPRLDSKILTDVINLIKTEPKGIQLHRLMTYVRDRKYSFMTEEHFLRQLQDVKHEVTIKGNTIFPVCHNSNDQTSWQGNFSSINKNLSNNNESKILTPSNFSRTKQFYDNNDDGYTENIANAGFSPEKIDSRPEIVERLHEENENDNVGEDVRIVDAKNNSSGMLVNERTKFRLQKLIEQRKDGIWCAELPLIYRKEYGVPLNYEDLGFESLLEYVTKLPEIFRWVRPGKTSDYKLYDAKAEEPEVRPSERPERLSLAELHDIYQYEGVGEDPIPTTLTPETSARLIPDGVMTIGETVAQISVTELFRDKFDTLDVVVADVVTPTFFWIHVLKRVPKFEQFMTELDEFYARHARKYVFPPILLEKGFNCACLYDGKWHRGIIKTVKPDYTVTVLLYDYGTVKSYSPPEVLFLHRSFSRLPAQAIPCGLYNIKPKFGTKWTYAACEAFLKMAFEQPMVAMRGSIDVDNNSMLIALTDTSGTDDVHINDWMVDEGYAVYGKMGETVDMEELRSDETPSTDDNEKIRNIDLDLETITAMWRNLSSTKIADNSPEILAELTKAIMTVGSLINRQITTNSNNVLSPNDNSPSNYVVDSVLSRESANSSTFERKDEINNIADLLENVHINVKNQRLVGDSICPPIPPLPNRKNETKYLKIDTNAFAKDENCVKNIYEDSSRNENDSRMNFRTNPHVTVSTPSWRPPLPPRSLNFFSESMTDDKNHSRTNSHERNATAPIFEREKTIDAAKKSSSRESFENSLQKCCKDFFQRLETNSKPNYPETNPFKIDIENNNYRSEIFKSSTNPFLIDNSTFDREKIVPTKIVYEAKPVYYDLSGKKIIDGKTVKSVGFVETKEKKLEESKMSDVASWIENGQRSNVDFFVDTDRVAELSRTKPVDRSCDWNFPRFKGFDYDEPKFEERERRSEEKPRNFVETRLTEQTVVIIHLNREGWITVDELVATFTDLKSTEELLKLLEIRDIQIPFRFIKRTDDLELFDQLDRTSLAVKRDNHGRIERRLHVVPIKSIMKILLELGLVDLKEIKRATSLQIYPKHSHALFDACSIINAYGNFVNGVRTS